MNIKQALQIPIQLVLERMNAKLAKEDCHEALYYSPFRKEKTASFNVNILKNVWYDFGEGTGGDVVNLVCLYLKKCNEDHEVADALRWLRNMVPTFQNVHSTIQQKDFQKHPKIILKQVSKLSHPALLTYLQNRGIPIIFAQKHVKEILACNKDTREKYFALGFKNEDGGWELRNPFFKGCIAPKTISFIRGQKPKPNSIHIFEGFMDYLSIATQELDGFANEDSIVLNSLSCLSQALPYIKNYGYKCLYSWLDNDDSGKRATITVAEFARTQIGLTHVPMNKLYALNKDVNEWHMKNLGLKIN